MAILIYQWLIAAWLLMVASPGNTTGENNRIPSRHPFYLSVTEVNQNATDKTLEISCKMFAEDLEAILEKNYKTTLDITSEKNRKEFDRLIADYTSKHFSLRVDGKDMKLAYIGFEQEDESAYCYFEISNIVQPRKFDIVNHILYDFNTAQMNIIHVTVKGERKSARLNYPDKLVTFEF